MVLGRCVGRLVVIGNDGSKIAGSLVVGDDIELPAAEVGEQRGLVVGCGDRSDLILVELLRKDGLELYPGAFECGRRDGGTCQPVGVNMLGQHHAVGRQQPLGAGGGRLGKFGNRGTRSHHRWVVRYRI